MIFFWGFLACIEAEDSTTSPSPKKVDVLRTPKHVSSSQEDFTKKSFFCCDNSNFQNILMIYLDLTRAMAQDQEKIALEKRLELENMFRNTLSKPEYQSDDTLQQLHLLLQNLQPTSLSDLQKNFAPFSIKMVEWIQSLKSKENTVAPKQQEQREQEQLEQNISSDTKIRVVVGFCPMAPPPGRWIQREDVIQNPFYGSKMLTCGVFE